MRVCHVITRNHCYKLEMKDQKKKRDPWRIQGVLHSILDRYKIQKLMREYAYGDNLHRTIYYLIFSSSICHQISFLSSEFRL